MANSRDPHFKFEPFIEPMNVDAEYVNWTQTLLMAMIRDEYGNSNYYVDYSRTDPSLLPEDRSQQPQFQFDTAKEGFILGFPGHVERMPKTLSPHLQPYQTDLYRRLEEDKPNRFAIGTAFTEASNATASAYTAGQQQASLPYSTLLAEQDRAQHRAWTYKYHGLKWFAAQDPPGTKTYWAAVMTGNESAVKYGSSAPKVGEYIEISADDLDYDFDLIVRTKSETLAEQKDRWMLGWDKFVHGVLDEEQLFREAGIDDIEGQKQRIDLMNIRQGFAPHQQMLDATFIMQSFKTATGIDLQALAASVPMGGSGPGTAPPNGQQPYQNSTTQPQNSETRMQSDRRFVAPAQGPAGGASGRGQGGP
jgi:hypothetical protein